MKKRVREMVMQQIGWDERNRKLAESDRQKLMKMEAACRANGTKRGGKASAAGKG